MELFPESFSLLSQNRNESAISVEREHLALHFPLIGSDLPDRVDRSFDARDSSSLQLFCLSIC